MIYVPIYGASNTGDRNLELPAWNGHGCVQLAEKCDLKPSYFHMLCLLLIHVWSHKCSKCELESAK